MALTIEEAMKAEELAKMQRELGQVNHSLFFFEGRSVVPSTPKGRQQAAKTPRSPPRSPKRPSSARSSASGTPREVPQSIDVITPRSVRFAAADGDDEPHNKRSPSSEREAAKRGEAIVAGRNESTTSAKRGKPKRMAYVSGFDELNWKAAEIEAQLSGSSARSVRSVSREDRTKWRVDPVNRLRNEAVMLRAPRR